jgi:dipeptidyl aminopeptidase/acylaminoacyl peptidase
VRSVLLLMTCAACGRLDFGEVSQVGDDAAPPNDGQVVDGHIPVCSAWSTPAPIANLETVNNDWEPALSPDRSSLVFSRQPATGGVDSLFVATRAQSGGFNQATTLTANVVQLTTDAGPAWSPDGKQLFFVSDRIAQDAMRLYVIDVTAGQFGPAAEVPELASTYVEGPAISNSGLELFYGDGITNSQMWRATRQTTASPWVVDRLLDELNSPQGDGWPSLSPDDLTIYWESDRDSVTGTIYAATRPSIGARFGHPAPVAELDTGTAEGDPDWFSETELLMAATRTDSVGGSDLYLSNRTCN